MVAELNLWTSFIASACCDHSARSAILVSTESSKTYASTTPPGGTRDDFTARKRHAKLE